MQNQESSNRCEIMLNYTDEKGEVAIEGYEIIIEDCCWICVVSTEKKKYSST